MIVPLHDASQCHPELLKRPASLISIYLTVSKLSPSSHVGIPISRTSQTRLTLPDTTHLSSHVKHVSQHALTPRSRCLRIHLHVPRTANRPKALASQPVTPVTPHSIHLTRPAHIILHTHCPACLTLIHYSPTSVASVRASYH